MFKAIGLVRLTRDPVLKPVGETHVCDFGVAVNEFYMKDGERQEISNFFECQLWDKGAEVFAKYAKKGHQVVIEARPRQDAWVDKETGEKRSKVYFRVDNFRFVTPKETDTSETEGADVTPF